jgi:hypothetical protein
MTVVVVKSDDNGNIDIAGTSSWIVVIIDTSPLDGDERIDTWIQAQVFICWLIYDKSSSSSITNISLIIIIIIYLLYHHHYFSDLNGKAAKHKGTITMIMTITMTIIIFYHHDYDHLLSWLSSWLSSSSIMTIMITNAYHLYNDSLKIILMSSHLLPVHHNHLLQRQQNNDVSCSLIVVSTS